mmetsp:Transcript_24881/g.62011  ORF Transcript_24881/g.62011 Transcript_24881/m.62011 type:complete len:237 (-) Transcript_24881:1185-1895(-)
MPSLPPPGATSPSFRSSSMAAGVASAPAPSLPASPLSFLTAASFLAALALALAVVDSTALTALPLSFLSSTVAGGGYANRLGLQCDVTEQCGIFSCASRPMNAVGTKVRLTKYASGDQYQYCVKTSMDTTAVMRGNPERARKPMVTLRPPASTMPCAMSAPILVIVTSRSSIMWLPRRLRKGARLASLCSTMTMAVAMSAPCCTKSTASVSIGSSSATASLSPVPAQQMPTAMAAP